MSMAAPQPAAIAAASSNQAVPGCSVQSATVRRRCTTDGAASPK